MVIEQWIYPTLPPKNSALQEKEQAQYKSSHCKLQAFIDTIVQ